MSAPHELHWHGSRSAWLRALVPLASVALFLAVLAVLGPILIPASDIPVADSLLIERIRIAEEGFTLDVRAQSPQPVRIAQVMIDGAYWTFSQRPAGPVQRMHRARIEVPFPWVRGETHHVRILTASGVSVDDTVEVAVATPRATAPLLARYTLLGLTIGLLPVTLGMLFLPALKALPRGGLEFVLALTIGLLAYLLVEMLIEGLELAAQASLVFHGAVLVWLPLVFTYGVLAAIGHSAQRDRSGLRVAVLVALGIGLHNLGEGLAVGAALAVNEVALGAFLFVGFALHNLTEGVGIASPLARERVHLRTLAALAALAGLPAVPGIWVGAFAFAPHWAALLFGVGAGAIVQVVVEIDRFLGARVREGRGRFSPASVAGYAGGAGLMYATALYLPA